MGAQQDFFSGSDKSLAIFYAIKKAIDRIGPSDIRISKSQIAFWASHGFAYVWLPAKYVKADALIVLSIALSQRIDSPRFKQVVDPTKKRWMHHIEINSPSEVDDEIVEWLRQAYSEAGP